MCRLVWILIVLSLMVSGCRSPDMVIHVFAEKQVQHDTNIRIEAMVRP